MTTGKVIFLNGSSSAGKTTLAIMLQQLLPEPYQHVALDGDLERKYQETMKLAEL